MRREAQIALLNAGSLDWREMHSLIEALHFSDRRDTVLSMALLHETGQMPPPKIALLMVQNYSGPEKF
jgi:hypothetical protein